MCRSGPPTYFRVKKTTGVSTGCGDTPSGEYTAWSVVTKHCFRECNCVASGVVLSFYMIEKGAYNKARGLCRDLNKACHLSMKGINKKTDFSVYKTFKEPKRSVGR